MQDRDSRFVVACATGPVSEDLLEQAVTITVERTHQRPLAWFSDGWREPIASPCARANVGALAWWFQRASP